MLTLPELFFMFAFVLPPIGVLLGAIALATLRRSSQPAAASPPPQVAIL
jgi:hypothetical protein